MAWFAENGTKVSGEYSSDGGFNDSLLLLVKVLREGGVLFGLC